MKSRGGNRSILLGFVLIGIGAVMLFVLLSNARPASMTVVVPKKTIKPFQLISGSDFEQVKIAKDRSPVGKRILTAKQLQKLTKDGKKPIFSTVMLMEGAVVDEQALGSSVTGSFAVVGPGELAVAVKTSLAGSVAGTAQPGSVVIATSDQATVNAKVICVGVSASDCRGAAPGADSGSAGGSQQKSDGGGDLVILLAVPAADAPSIAGATVNLALNPHCTVSDAGQLRPVGSAFAEECARLSGVVSSKSGEDADDPDTVDD